MWPGMGKTETDQSQLKGTSRSVTIQLSSVGQCGQAFIMKSRTTHNYERIFKWHSILTTLFFPESITLRLAAMYSAEDLLVLQAQ